MRRPGSIEALASLEVERAKDRRAVARRLAGELAPWGGTIAVAMAFVLASAGASAFAPYLVGRAIDGAIARGDGGALARTMALLFVVYAVGAVAQREQTRRVGAIGQHVLAAMRARLFARLQVLPLGYFDKRPIGDLMSRLLADVDTLNQFFSQGLTQLIGSMLGLVAVLVAMLVLHARLALACFTVIPVMLFATWAFAAQARNAYRKTRQTVGDVTAGIQEEIVGVRQAQAFNRTEVNITRFRSRNAANRDANVSAVAVTSAFSPTIDALSTLATALVIGYGGWLVLHGQMRVGLLTAFLIYVQNFFRPVQLAASIWTLMQSALAGAERVYGVLDAGAEPPDAPDALALARVEGRLEFDHVTFGYDAARPVLRDVSFVLEAGQTMAIVGRTGAGKTTIASLIPRFYDPDGGAVKLDGYDLRALTRASVRRQTAMVLQEPFLFARTVAENIAFGRPGADRAAVETAARAVHAHDFIASLPNGYDTELGEAGGSLSQGQRQLLAFARAVLADPRVLILDEATANIDTRTEAVIQRALATLLAGRTSVVIAHRLSTIRNADVILVLEDGRVIERGSHDELVARDGAYAELYRKQFREAPARGARPSPAAAVAAV